MLQLANTVVARFKEPSTWAGIAASLAGLLHFTDPGFAAGIELVGAGGATLLSIFLAEKAKPVA